MYQYLIEQLALKMLASPPIEEGYDVGVVEHLGGLNAEKPSSVVLRGV